MIVLLIKFFLSTAAVLYVVAVILMAYTMWYLNYVEAYDGAILQWQDIASVMFDLVHMFIIMAIPFLIFMFIKYHW